MPRMWRWFCCDGGMGKRWIVAAGTENPVLRARKYLLFYLFSTTVYMCAYILLLYTVNAKHRCFIVNPPKQTDFHFSQPR